MIDVGLRCWACGKHLEEPETHNLAEVVEIAKRHVSESLSSKRILVGLAGYGTSGKDTVGLFLHTERDFHRVAFADPVKEALTALNPAVGLQQGRDGEVAVVRMQDLLRATGGMEKAKEQPEVRRLLQHLGTDMARNLWGESFWTDMAMRRINEMTVQNPSVRIVITDVRFPNEANAIRGAGGIVVRVQREGVGPLNDHISENAMNDYSCDAVINNDHSLEDLKEEVMYFADLLLIEKKDSK